MKKKGNSYLTTYYTLPVKTPNNEGYAVWSFVEDNNGNIWAGTYLAGLFKLEGNQFIKDIVKTEVVKMKGNKDVF